MPSLITGKGVRLVGQVRAGITNWWREYRKSKSGVIGLIIFIIILFGVVVVPFLISTDPRERNADEKLLAPATAHYEIKTDLMGFPILDENGDPVEVYVAGHLLGTDDTGRDLFAQLLYAGRNSLFIGIVTSVVVIGAATLVGLFAGYYGGIIDELLMRLADILMVLPRLPLLIVMAAMMDPTIWTIMMIIALLGWTRPARQIRALALSLKHYDYVESTKASGGGSVHIIFRHIFPNVTGIVVAHFVMEVVAVILLESGLSFLGLGDPTRFTWGQTLHLAQVKGALPNGQWWWWLPTGLAITAVCFSLAFIGTTLNDRFVLRLNQRGKD
ncbi:MAG: ABC transporter permease [Chloroflexi bacterium]|jgi:peptide/nickel transport system permease protein|nr:ABC transporter permease [Chloroflexota bacterium]MBT7082525.1 ABC transporter permease [Chloroflexota bacterium]MBT7289614.1 ABC transporter permease [Chloroflexota bacterium]